MGLPQPAHLFQGLGDGRPSTLLQSSPMLRRAPRFPTSSQGTHPPTAAPRGNGHTHPFPGWGRAGAAHLALGQSWGLVMDAVSQIP